MIILYIIIIIIFYGVEKDFDRHAFHTPRNVEKLTPERIIAFMRSPNGHVSHTPVNIIIYYIPLPNV